MKYLPNLSWTRYRFIISGCLIILVASLLAAWLIFQTLSKPLSMSQPSAIFEVAAGSSLSQVSRDLQSSEFITYPRLFILLARLRGVENSIRVGEYEINEGVSAIELLDKMVSGDTLQYRVTLIEGWTFEQALAAIQASDKITILLDDPNPATILEKLSLEFGATEGILFPDTYFYTAGSSDLDIVKRASAKLENILQKEWQNRLGALPYETPYEALIMASIIEKESAASSERGRIAGVFVRRLELGMRLQSDPTVIYGMGDVYQGDIRRSDLQTVTPYNTYRVNGLPPTPIALAGADSIHASLNPETSDYLYFVAQRDGSHYFSSSLEEHNQAVARLLSGE